MKHRSLPAPIVIIMITYFVCFFFWQWFISRQAANTLGSPTYDVGYFVAAIAVAIQYGPAFIAIIGLILALNSKYKKSGLLRFYMAVYVLLSPILILIDLFGPVVLKSKIDESVLSRTLLYAWIAVSVIFLCACVVGLLILSKNRVPKFNYQNFKGEITPVFYCVSRVKRFFHLILDIAIYYYTALLIMASLNISREPSSVFSNPVYLLFQVAFILICYLFFESIFQCTPAKCLTNTIVVNKICERPEFVQILKRSLSRLIPFEAFSFFGYPSRGWHDSLSGTYVVNATDIDAEKPEGVFREAEVGF